MVGKKTIIIGVALLVLALVLSTFVYLDFQKPYSAKTESITVGMELNQVNLLIYVAENQGYFADNGLDVTIKNYSSGASATVGMLNGEVSIATATEFVVANNALSNGSLKVFASIDKFLQIYVIGNKNSGIENVTDLVGKKIGLPLQTAAEFYLGRFLELNNVDIDQVSIVNVSPPQIQDAITNGTVDAVATWQPYVGAIESQLGNRIVMWDAQSGQVAFDCAISTNNWISNHPDLIKRFLNSLLQAEDYVTNQPNQAKVIMQNQLNLTAEYVDTVWPQYRFSLTLDQSLILAMQDESRWITEVTQTSMSVPNFLNYVYIDGLQSVDSESVNIVT
jgi:ABC-type nitrate/sulfonate/bicarbonate transport system substrate-binding protein